MKAKTARRMSGVKSHVTGIANHIKRLEKAEYEWALQLVADEIPGLRIRAVGFEEDVMEKVRQRCKQERYRHEWRLGYQAGARMVLREQRDHKGEKDGL